MTGYRLADNVGTAKMDYSLDSKIVRVPSCSRITPKLMLQAISLGVDGIILAESEEKSNPFPHSVSAVKQNISKAQEVLKQGKIDVDRIHFVQFVTVMLAGFVNNVNGLSERVRKKGPIPPEKCKSLGKDLGKKLFG
jgi:coenzyme F420-reducing hydrogenase delta subunit